MGRDKMPRKLTKEIKYVRLPEQRIREIQDLVISWPHETMAFMRARLNQYKPPSDLANILLDFLLSLFINAPKKKFDVLKDPDILTDWQKRFEISGQTNPQEAWNKILEKEVSAKDYAYLLSLLDKELTDVHIPVELGRLFEKIYRASISAKNMFPIRRFPKRRCFYSSDRAAVVRHPPLRMPLSGWFLPTMCCRK